MNGLRSRNDLRRRVWILRVFVLKNVCFMCGDGLWMQRAIYEVHAGSWTNYVILDVRKWRWE
jgi:hypothetical protein